MAMFDSYVLNPLIDSVKNFGVCNAFCIDDKFYTYNDFAVRITRIRKSLQCNTILSKNIGLVVNDDLETYASIFAIWLEGYAYVPLHPLQPIERSLEIISQAEVELVIDSSAQTAFTTIRVIESISLEGDEVWLLSNITDEESLAYILFTSGSTGKPKGVSITRKNIGAFMKSFWSAGFDISSVDRCLQCFDLTFDVSVQSYLVPLTRGACTYTVPHNQIKYSYVFGLLDDHAITFGAMAPSMIRYLRPYFEEINLPNMRYVILTAEASPLDLVMEWAPCIPNAEIYDFYGPTEATIYCTYNKIIRGGPNKQLNGMLSIGKPMSGIEAIVIDEERNALGFDQKGELCVSGDQITPGYWRNDEKNVESFFEKDKEGITKRFYKTGDSCFIDGDGDIMLAGRLDHQVKIQGYRVELGEIEYHAREFLQGKNAIAVTYSIKNENCEIALFVESGIMDVDLLLEYLKRKMPHYMIPAKIIMKDVFPLNTSGKTDRIALKKMLL